MDWDEREDGLSYCEAIEKAIAALRNQPNAYTPNHIDREAWEPCGRCKSCGNCHEAGKATGEKINYAHPCHSCLNGDNFKPVEFCRYCGRPLTEEAWASWRRGWG